MKKIVLFAFAALIATTTSAAPEMPPGRWWKNPGVAERLGLDAAQQARLDGIFQAAANELIDRRGDVQKMTLALRTELEKPELDRQSLQQVAARLSAARGRLFERELMMLADIREVLTAAQWKQIREQTDRRRKARPRP